MYNDASNLRPAERRVKKTWKGDIEEASPSYSQKMTPSSLLLWVPTSSDSPGTNVAGVVLKEVDEAGVRDKIIHFCFYTTVSNTGLLQSACIQIEQELRRSLLWLVCRHHIYAVILKNVFDTNLGSSSGTDIGNFRRLCARGFFVNSLQKEMVKTLEDIVNFFATNDTASKLKDDALAFLKEVLISKNPFRKHYKELRLSFFFLFLLVKVPPNILPWLSPPVDGQGPLIASSFKY